ncbi:MAG TPA: ABC transporter ATP-binding protein [Chloroflexota bacterium]|nr:ABC transporter ATP-binding protein [Chloroflexota bacterium]
MTLALEVRGVFAGYGEICALWDFSLSVQPGEISVLLGRNGSGKTTALSAIAGIVKMSAGSIRLNGQELVRLPAYRRTRLGLALVQENKRIFRHRTVEENLRLGGFWRYGNGKELKAAMDRECERFPVLREKWKRPASTLSGGEQQMLGIAQALVSRPTVLMLDEPSAGLAPDIVNRVFACIAQLKTEGIAVLLVEQLVHQPLQLADHIAVLDLGRLALHKPAAEITDVSEIEDVYLGKREKDPEFR